MGFRLQRSIRLGKFVRLNISKSGVGFSAGVRGLRVSHGPSGTHFTAGLPGTGLSYRKKIGGGTKKKKARKQNDVAAQSGVATKAVSQEPVGPKPGFFAPRHEKELYRGLQAYEAEDTETALDHFLNAAPKEPGAGILAAAILTHHIGREFEGVGLLEAVVQSNKRFPTPLMRKYLYDLEIEIDITPTAVGVVPIDGLAATLLLVELYQKQRRIREAISLLEELDELIDDPALTLSLVELYATRNLWDNIIERAQQTESEDDVTLATTIFYGRALQEKNLHEAAVSIFGKSIRRTKDRNPLLLSEARYWRAISYEAQGKYQQASVEFEKVYAGNPNFRDVGERVQQFAVR